MTCAMELQHEEHCLELREAARGGGGRLLLHPLMCIALPGSMTAFHSGEAVGGRSCTYCCVWNEVEK